MTLSLAPLLPEHWPQVQAIYAEGLATGLAAFATDTYDWATWNDEHLEIGRFVSETANGKITGWSALSPVPDT